MPKVINIKRTNYKVPDGAVYVGRDAPRFGLKGSKWGNPFVIGRDGDRDEVIAKYAHWLDGMMHNGILDLDELQGKDLVCWCAPEKCHADVLIELANK